MSFIYCPACGAKVEYSMQKPKFCTSCGEPMDFHSSATAAQDKAPSTGETPSGNEDRVPKLKGLDVDLDYSFARSFTFEELSKMPEGDIDRPRPKKLKGNEDPIKESMNECLPGRRHSIGGDLSGE